MLRRYALRGRVPPRNGASPTVPCAKAQVIVIPGRAEREPGIHTHRAVDVDSGPADQKLAAVEISLLVKSQRANRPSGRCPQSNRRYRPTGPPAAVGRGLLSSDHAPDDAALTAMRWRRNGAEFGEAKNPNERPGTMPGLSNIGLAIMCRSRRYRLYGVLLQRWRR